MKTAPTILDEPSCRLSDEGRVRLLSRRGEPLFFAGWERVLFVHFEVDAAQLQRDVPFELDLRDGKAFVSLVAFTMRGMRPRIGGKFAAWLFKPVATHEFLNVRTYVNHRGERGIYFIAEWLSNRLSIRLGPLLYGLPYRFAKINYSHAHEENFLSGKVENPHDGNFCYKAQLPADKKFCQCENNSFDEFLLERYTAFTSQNVQRSAGTPLRRFFRVWHPPWPQKRAEVSISENSLLTKTFPWFAGAELVGANYSPGFSEVWMGRAQRVK